MDRDQHLVRADRAANAAYQAGEQGRADLCAALTGLAEYHAGMDRELYNRQQREAEKTEEYCAHPDEEEGRRFMEEGARSMRERVLAEVVDLLETHGTTDALLNDVDRLRELPLLAKVEKLREEFQGDSDG